MTDYEEDAPAAAVEVVPFGAAEPAQCMGSHVGIVAAAPFLFFDMSKPHAPARTVRLCLSCALGRFDSRGKA